ncbi:hypothetical protein DEU56DRAFT_468306 [Suillus clintonianus]|uniref:uncharacterized protein n=1 Tax=Suillus clintonianus TaxID=1904413 RepID=UPI001B87F6E6|nr:uncharacterized protein DEU56DRAFT_468306 [Suillus clintonianus]KAG2130376.1 hypothetical protein DEU56DRAFT_468306 [Suillus clintonianus]
MYIACTGKATNICGRVKGSKLCHINITTYSVLAVFLLFTHLSISPFTHTYSLLIMNNDIPPALGRRRVTLELTERLCSQKHFLDGINDLLKFGHSQDSELQRHGRKIIALTEVARSTLTRVGVKLYLFVICSQTFLPLKSAYFKMLVFIRSRKHAFPSELDDRINRLLHPLRTHLVIRCGGVDTRVQLGIDELLVSPTAPAVGKGTCLPAASAANVMPPPDAFMNKRERINRFGEFIKQQSTGGSHARKHLVPRQYPAGAVDSSDSEEERLVAAQYPVGDPGYNRANPPVPKQYLAADVIPGDEGPSRPRRVFARTNTQNFGIFCTGKRPVSSAKTARLY